MPIVNMMYRRTEPLALCFVESDVAGGRKKPIVVIATMQTIEKMEASPKWKDHSFSAAQLLPGPLQGQSHDVYKGLAESIEHAQFEP